MSMRQIVSEIEAPLAPLILRLLNHPGVCIVRPDTTGTRTPQPFRPDIRRRPRRLSE